MVDAKVVADLEKKISALKDENAGLKTSSSKARETDAYVKTLIAEVEGLKKQLLSSDERLMDLQQDMQSKVDSAKLMAKELSARLQKSAEANAALEAAAAARAKAPTPTSAASSKAPAHAAKEERRSCRL